MFPLPLNYIYIAVAIAVAGMIGTIAYQNKTINGLEAEKTLFVSKNKELAERIEVQNASLKEGAAKYESAQRQIDVAAGKNSALTAEFAKLRGSWKEQPLPKDCPAAIVELKTRASDISKNWNTQ